MQLPAVTAQRQRGLPYKWVVAMVVIFGLFMTILDATIVNIAIPRLQNVFGAGLTSVQWVLTAYTLVQGVATPLTAFLAVRFGQKRLYLIALASFTIGSALCGFSWNLPMLIFFRVLQGATGAFMSPLAITLLWTEFPPNEQCAFYDEQYYQCPGHVCTLWRPVHHSGLPAEFAWSLCQRDCSVERSNKNSKRQARRLCWLSSSTRRLRSAKTSTTQQSVFYADARPSPQSYLLLAQQPQAFPAHQPLMR